MTATRPEGLLACIEEDLAKVEERLLAETRSDIGEVRAISGHTLLSGGKRLRPAIALLAAHCVGRKFDTHRAYAAAAAVELIHMATLMHDDVVDEAPERRGRPTANAVYGNSITILTGDFLLAKAIWLLSRDEENLALVRLFADVTIAMAEGEVLQAAVARNWNLNLATYEQVIERKTARFLAGCTEAGGLMGGGTEQETAALRAYGHHLGIAFQIADDLLDFLGDPKQTGKELGTDLRDGRVTLPLIHTLTHCDAATKAVLLTILERGQALTDSEVAHITATIARHGGFEVARTEANTRMARALTELDRFPDSEYKSSLIQLAGYVVARDR
ncbi:polyprenyl synthetase family protein [Armatimonas sp.]|uniref:polyprenyl synthetase family protein n=1 Tax=Armatimonas sp. TaxID=1872638 RepID=UPI00286B3E19|nr:polyprenyl synthetase family protein [Armatimonas sp.]